MISSQDDSHTEPAALWRLSEGAFRQYHDRSPVRHALVLYYVGGWLLALVHAVGTAKLANLGGAKTLARLLDWLEDIGINDTSQRSWNLNSTQRRAFYPPKKAAEQFRSRLRSIDDRYSNLAIAATLAQTYSIPYAQRQRIVLDYLRKWLLSVQERGETFGSRRAAPSIRSN